MFSARAVMTSELRLSASEHLSAHTKPRGGKRVIIHAARTTPQFVTVTHLMGSDFVHTKLKL